MRLKTVAALTVALIALGCCARQPPPEPAPRPAPPRPSPVPAPPPAPLPTDWRDWPITPGSWSLRQDARGPIALFGQGGSGSLFTIRCDAASNAIHLSRAGDARGANFAIHTTTLTRALPTQPVGSDAPSTVAILRSDDRLLDAIGFSRGRFVVEAPPLATLVIPAWPEVLRVVEDCRG